MHMLDRFICHLFRHRGKTRTWEIEPYLISDLHWKAPIARWVVARIETGLELLRVRSAVLRAPPHLTASVE